MQKKIEIKIQFISLHFLFSKMYHVISIVGYKKYLVVFSTMLGCY